MKIGVKFLAIESVTLKPIIERLLVEYSSEIKKRRITVSFPEQDSAWPPVRVDNERVKDVLAILLDNAVRYNRENGSILIETEQRRNVLILRISNAGLQLDAGARAHLFKQSFFRGAVVTIF